MRFCLCLLALGSMTIATMDVMQALLCRKVPKVVLEDGTEPGNDGRNGRDAICFSCWSFAGYPRSFTNGTHLLTC
uniref:Small secreted candidate effector n=1 Tax=Rhynchosporium graminicola TaxID=2792576 RepID=A0A1V0G096_9HELO|nr:small secreted candidate effector [Rhynchosporium commune]